jgi:putative endonuclease
MKYVVYILYSPIFKRTYTGQTKNLENRFSFHNSGKVRSTKAYRPWILIHYESFNTRSEAMQKEDWFKSFVGRSRINKILNDFLNTANNS